MTKETMDMLVSKGLAQWTDESKCSIVLTSVENRPIIISLIKPTTTQESVDNRFKKL